MPSNQGSQQLLSSTIPIFHQEKQLASAQKSWSTEQEKLKFAKELNASLLQNRPLTEFFSPGFKGTAGRLGGVNKEKQQANQTRPFFHKDIVKYPK